MPGQQQISLLAREFDNDLDSPSKRAPVSSFPLCCSDGAAVADADPEAPHAARLETITAANAALINFLFIFPSPLFFFVH